MGAADQRNLFSPSSGRGFSEEDKSVTAPFPLSLSVLDLLHANTTYTQIHIQDAYKKNSGATYGSLWNSSSASQEASLARQPKKTRLFFKNIQNIGASTPPQ